MGVSVLEAGFGGLGTLDVVVWDYDPYNI